MTSQLKQQKINYALRILHENGVNVPDEDARTALNMIRNAIDELFGPYANLASQDGVLLNHGPRCVDEAWAMIEALTNISDYIQKLEATRNPPTAPSWPSTQTVAPVSWSSKDETI